jgi:hypothetical protein
MSSAEAQSDMVLSHIEKYFSGVPLVWKQTKDGSVLPFQVLKFADAPFTGGYTCVTYGLSTHIISLASGDVIRAELVMSAESGFQVDSVVALLLAVGNYVIRGHFLSGLCATLPGEGAVFDNPKFEHIFLSNRWAGSFVFDVLKSTNPYTHFIRVLPISSSELDYIKSHSCHSFENELIDQGINMLELDRRTEVRTKQ